MLVCVGAMSGAALAGAVVDFEETARGTTFGALDGHFPGQLVLSQNGIDMRVEDFYFGQSVKPGFAEVGGIFDPDFASTPLSIDTLNLVFEFGRVGFPVTEVSFEFIELGGLDNFAVNGGELIQLSPLTALRTNVAPGVMATVETGMVTLTGSIQSFLIGGQELGIDNVRAVPEPASLVLLAVGGWAVCGRLRRGK